MSHERLSAPSARSTSGPSHLRRPFKGLPCLGCLRQHFSSDQSKRFASALWCGRAECGAAWCVLCGRVVVWCGSGVGLAGAVALAVWAYHDVCGSLAARTHAHTLVHAAQARCGAVACGRTLSSVGDCAHVRGCYKGRLPPLGSTGAERHMMLLCCGARLA